MRIFYDGEIYGMQKVGGISRYFDNIISRLPKDFQPSLTSPLARKDHHVSHPNLKIFPYRRFRPGRVFHGLEYHYFELAESLNNYQIFHPTYYSLLTGDKPSKKRYPVVLTVHDMIHEIFPDLIDQNGKIGKIKCNAILRADVILCVSENTKKDLLERYPLPEEKIWVTYLATEFSPNWGYSNEPISSRPFFLYVGGRITYKNFNNLLKAFSKIVSIVPDAMLCIVGSSFSSAEQRIIGEMNLDNHIHNVGYVSDSHLAKLYRHCIALVYPSLYEGFGIPLLEAMICQAPVIASNTSSIPEVVGDAAQLFDPRSVNDLAESLLLLLEHPLQRENMIIKGLEQVKKFSWDKTVSKTLQAYQYALNFQR